MIYQRSQLQVIVDGRTKDLFARIQTFYNLIESLSSDDEKFKENLGRLVIELSQFWRRLCGAQKLEFSLITVEVLKSVVCYTIYY